MKSFLFKVTLISGISLTCSGIGYDIDSALMDACDYLAKTDYPQDDIVDVELLKV